MKDDAPPDHTSGSREGRIKELVNREWQVAPIAVCIDNGTVTVTLPLMITCYFGELCFKKGIEMTEMINRVVPGVTVHFAGPRESFNVRKS